MHISEKYFTNPSFTERDTQIATRVTDGARRERETARSLGPFMFLDPGNSNIPQATSNAGPAGYSTILSYFLQ